MSVETQVLIIWVLIVTIVLAWIGLFILVKVWTTALKKKVEAHRLYTEDVFRRIEHDIKKQALTSYSKDSSKTNSNDTIKRSSIETVERTLDKIYKDVNEDTEKIKANLNEVIRILVNRLNINPEIFSGGKEDTAFSSKIMSTLPSKTRDESSMVDFNPISERSRGRNFVNLYNTALDNGSTRGTLEKEFHPRPVGISNGQERLSNPETSPILRETPNGSYWLVEDQGATLIVPKLGLVVKSTHWNSLGIDFIYEYQGKHSDQDTYEVAALIEPALVEEKRDGEWHVQQKGEVDFR